MPALIQASFLLFFSQGMVIERHKEAAIENTIQLWYENLKMHQMVVLVVGERGWGEKGVKMATLSKANT